MPRCNYCRATVSYSFLPDSEDCLGNTFPFPKKRMQWMVLPVFFFLPSFILGRMATGEPFYVQGSFLLMVLGSSLVVGCVTSRAGCYLYLTYGAIASALYWCAVMPTKLPLPGFGGFFPSYLVAHFAILLPFIRPFYIFTSLVIKQFGEDFTQRHVADPVERFLDRSLLISFFSTPFMLGVAVSFFFKGMSLVFPMIPAAVAGITMGPYFRRGYFLFLCYGVAAAWCWFTVRHTKPPLPGFERFYSCYLLAASLVVLLPYLYLMRLILDGENVKFWPESCCLCALEKYGGCAYNENGCHRCLDRSQRLKWRREEEARAIAFLMSSHARLGASSAAGMLQGGGGPLEMIVGFAEGVSRLSLTEIEWAVAAGKCALTQKGTPCKICLTEGQLCQKYHAPR